MSDTTNNNGVTVTDTTLEPALTKQAIRQQSLAVTKPQELETKPHQPDANSKKPGFFKASVLPVFYKDKKVTKVGIATGAMTVTLAVVGFLKVKKERDWSRQQLKTGSTIAALTLNTNSDHIKGLLHV